MLIAAESGAIFEINEDCSITKFLLWCDKTFDYISIAALSCYAELFMKEQFFIVTFCIEDDPIS